MKARREISFALVFLILSILACNMPSASRENTDSGDTSSEPSPNVTYVVVVEDTATNLPTETPIPVTIVDQIALGKELSVIGRSEDNEWWQVVNATGRECWVVAENATPNQDFSTLTIGNAPPLPGVPLNFYVVDQVCQSAQKKFSVTLSWSSGGGETSFRIYRDGKAVQEVKASRFNFKDTNAPYNKNIVYEIEALNENGASQRATQIVPACK